MNIFNFLNMTILSLFNCSALEFKLNFDNFFQSLKYMGIGMLCIFIVIGVIILVTFALNKITSSIADKNKDKEDNNN